jgi:hypothetical protein
MSRSSPIDVKVARILWLWNVWHVVCRSSSLDTPGIFDLIEEGNCYTLDDQREIGDFGPRSYDRSQMG